jgi:hypothetical protein
MRGGSRVTTIENSALIGRGGLLSVPPRAKTVPPNLAGIYRKGRETRRFRSSKTADTVICALKSIYHR